MALAILQARVSSTRLPAKVLQPILGEPMIARQIERIARARGIEKIVLATSEDATDDPLADLANKLGIGIFRGNLTDVLDRFYRAALTSPAATIVRLTGDCPLADPEVIDRTIDYFRHGGFDYVSDALEPTFPDGLDVEVFKFAALEAAWKEAHLPSEREHVTPFIYGHKERFNIGSYKQVENWSHLRWTVDEPRDLDFVRAIYDRLYPVNAAFGMTDILRLIESEPELSRMNAKIQRNEGYAKSLTKDQEYLKRNQE